MAEASTDCGVGMLMKLIYVLPYKVCLAYIVCVLAVSMKDIRTCVSSVISVDILLKHNLSYH